MSDKECFNLASHPLVLKVIVGHSWLCLMQGLHVGLPEPGGGMVAS